MKTRKSLTKRLKVTRKGKVLARKPGFNHFNSKQSRSTQLAGRRGTQLDLSNKVKNTFLQNV
jgi:ribosomal protein L35